MEPTDKCLDNVDKRSRDTGIHDKHRASMEITEIASEHIRQMLPNNEYDVTKQMYTNPFQMNNHQNVVSRFWAQCAYQNI